MLESLTNLTTLTGDLLFCEKIFKQSCYKQAHVKQCNRLIIFRFALQKIKAKTYIHRTETVGR